MRVFIIFLIATVLASCVPIVEETHYYTGKISRVDVNLPSGVYNVEILKDGEVILSGIYESKLNKLSFDVIFRKSGDYDLEISGESFHETFKIHVEPIPWLVFIWMSADNSLEGQDIEDISEMKPSGYVAVHIVRDSTVDEYLVISNDGSLVRNLESVNGGSGVQLREFLEDFSSIDSIHKAVVIWNHGWAWMGDSSYNVEVVGIDEDSKDALTISELGKALEGMGFDILGFDACYMGSLEVLYELKDSASLVIASPGPEPWKGWNYSFLGDIKVDTDSSEFSKLVISRYEYEYSGDPHIPDLTGLFVYSTDGVGNFTGVLNSFDVDDLVLALKNSTPEVVYSTSGARILVDSESLFSGIEVLKSAVREIILGGVNLKGDVSLSIYFPDEKGLNYMDDYRTLRFSSETIWLEVLEGLYGTR